MVFFNCRQSAKSASCDYSDPCRIFFGYGKPGIPERLISGRDCVLDKKVRALCKFSIHKVLRIEVLYFRRYLDGKIFRIKTRDCGDTAFPFAQAAPGLFNPGTQWGYQTDTGYHNSFVHPVSPYFVIEFT